MGANKVPSVYFFYCPKIFQEKRILPKRGEWALVCNFYSSLYFGIFFFPLCSFQFSGYEVVVKAPTLLM